MKKLKLISCLVLISSFMLTSCEKEELPKQENDSANVNEQLSDIKDIEDIEDIEIKETIEIKAEPLAEDGKLIEANGDKNTSAKVIRTYGIIIAQFFNGFDYTGRASTLRVPNNVNGSVEYRIWVPHGVRSMAIAPGCSIINPHPNSRFKADAWHARYTHYFARSRPYPTGQYRVRCHSGVRRKEFAGNIVSRNGRHRVGLWQNERLAQNLQVFNDNVGSFIPASRSQWGTAFFNKHYNDHGKSPDHAMAHRRLGHGSKTFTSRQARQISSISFSVRAHDPFHLARNGRNIARRYLAIRLLRWILREERGLRHFIDTGIDNFNRLTGRRHSRSTFEELVVFYEDCVASCLANYDRHNNRQRYERCLNRCGVRFISR